MTILLLSMLALGLASTTAAAPPAVPTLDPSQLHPGQRAMVHTVFRGDSIEAFEAEIVGVMRGGRVDGDLILAKATTARVVHEGIAAGMSGSPVYVDGKLIGALSSGWSFSRDPLFGITPIAEMLQVLRKTSPPHPGTSAGPTGVEAAGSRARVSFAGLSWDDPDMAAADRDPAPVAPGRGGPVPLPVALACGGWSQEARRLLGGEFERLGFAVSPGGRGAAKPSAPARMEPGAACAVDLLRGDLQFSAIGTVTYREGDRVLIFGHPFFQAGDVSLPLSTAEIVTIVASDQSSFKLGVSGREVGEVTQDRRAAVAGTLGPAPRLLPLRVGITAAGSPPQNFTFESIEDRSLAPLLIATAASNSLLESGGTGVHQTLRWSARLHRKGAAPLVLSDIAAGDSPPQEFVAGLLLPLRFLYNNPYQRLDLDSVTVSVAVEPGRAQWTLRGARVLAASVRPGGTVRVLAELEHWRGAREERVVEIAVPEELPDGRYPLWLGGGAEQTRYESGKLPARYRPLSLDDAWQRMRAVRSSDALYATLYAQAPEVTIEGRDYPELPASALALMAGGSSSVDRARRGDLATVSEQRQRLDGAVRGEILLQIQVDSKAP